MEFYLKLTNRGLYEVHPALRRISHEEDLLWSENQLVLLENDFHSRSVCIRCDKKMAWIFGDPVIADGSLEKLEKYLGSADIRSLVESIQGHYRLVVFDEQSCRITVSGSLFGMLPIFYTTLGDDLYISSDQASLAELTGKERINRRFLLENILFYYPLFDQTVYSGVKLLPTHHVLEINEHGYSVFRSFHMADWFVTNPRAWRKSTGELSDLFIERSGVYLPGSPYAQSLTGGFDSRVLTGCGLYHKKDFEPFVFGNGLSDDVAIAGQLASVAALQLNVISLDVDYIIHHSLDNGLEFILNANGMAGFARAHYLYTVKNLQSRFKYMVTGNFGSEIFRSVHQTGELISNNLFSLMTSSSMDQAFRKIERSAEFSWIRKENFAGEWEELKQEISQLPFFNKEFSGLTKNQRFYLFVFEEVFRKYFGAEMINESRYVNNRTPFLDSVFLKQLFTTGLPGVYSDFNEKNPLNRFKGQVLYGHILKKTFPSFMNVLTNKGYKPADLMSVQGNARILMAYLKKRFNRKYAKIDPNSVEDAFQQNLDFFKNLPVQKNLFNTEKFRDACKNGYHHRDFLIAQSQSWFLNTLLGQRQNQLAAG